MIYKFGKKKLEITSIAKIEKDRRAQYLIENLRKEITLIDKEIGEVAYALIEAQKVQIRTNFQKKRNWLFELQKKWVSNAANQSANWHSNKLLALYQKRWKLKVSLDKATGKYWPNQLKRFGFILFVFSLIILIISLTYMSVLIAIYSLPIWLAISIAYWIKKKKKIKKL